jgi:hypothetical protein
LCRGLQKLAGINVAALIADTGMRSRDERFKDPQVHKHKSHPLHDKGRKTKQAKAVKRYRPTDFRYDANAGTCICPAGKTQTRQVCFFRGKADDTQRYADIMKRAIDSERGRGPLQQTFCHA